MAAYLDALTQVWNFLLTVLSAVWGLYTSQPVLMSFFTLWLLDRIFGIFDLIKG